MKRNHWWGAALGAGVIAGAVLLAPSAQASPHPASHKTVVKVVVQSRTAANRGRVIVQHHGDSHDHHGDGHHGHHAPPPPPPPPAHHEHGDDHHEHGDDHHEHGDDHHEHGDDHHHHGYPGGSEACVTVNAHEEHDGWRIDGEAKNGDTGYEGRKAGVYVSKDGKNWKKAGETTTGKGGSFAYRLKGHSGEQVKAVVAGVRGGSAAQSAAAHLGHKKHA